MHNLGVRSKMMIVLALAVFASAVIALNSTLTMRQLGELQDDGQRLSQLAATSQDGAGIGPRLYQVVADTVINRQFDEAAKDWAAELQLARTELAQLGKDAGSAQQASLAEATRALDEMVRLYDKEMLPLAKAEPPDWPAIRALDGKIDVQAALISAAMKKVAESTVVQMNAADAEFDSTRQASVRNNIIVGVITAALLAGLIGWISRDLLRMLGGEPSYAAEVTGRIATGDLSQRIRIESNDSQSLLAHVEKMRQALTTMISDIKHNAVDVEQSAHTVSRYAGDIAQSSARQSDAAGSSAAAIEQLTVSIGHMADSAADSNLAAKEAGELTLASESSVLSAAAEVQQISVAVTDVGAMMQSLNEQAQHITGVVNIIKDIADQTNLLALNAAIEAARAGEQGRGFAVVADEVRKLAERTTQSTSEIADVIAGIQQRTNDAVVGVERTRSRATQGTELATVARESMVTVRQGTNNVVTALNEISCSLQEQRSASTEIAQNVERIAQMAEQNNQSSAGIAQATRELSELSASLRQLTDRFTVG